MTRVHCCNRGLHAGGWYILGRIPWTGRGWLEGRCTRANDCVPAGNWKSAYAREGAGKETKGLRSRTTRGRVDDTYTDAWVQVSPENWRTRILYPMPVGNRVNVGKGMSASHIHTRNRALAAVVTEEEEEEVRASN